MTSFFRVLGYASTNIDNIIKIMNDKQICELIDNVNKQGPSEYAKKFITNLIFELFDDVVMPFVKNEENEKIFSEENKLSKNKKIKLYISKLTLHISGTNTFNTFATDLMLFGGNKKDFIEVLKRVVEDLYKIVDSDKVNCGADIYKNAVENFTVKLMNIYTENYKSDSNDTISNSSIDEFISAIINEINIIYRKKPLVDEYIENYNFNNNSDTESNSDSDGEKNIEPPAKRQRTDDFNQNNNKDPIRPNDQ